MLAVQCNTDNVSFWVRQQVCWKTITKDSGSSSLGFLFCNQPRQVSSGPHRTLLWELRLEELVPGNEDTLATPTAEANKLFFVPKPGVSCLLPASMKW